MDGRRTLTCVITSGCSEPGYLIYWLQGGTEQLLQSFTMCVCVCSRLQMFLRVDLP